MYRCYKKDVTPITQLFREPTKRHIQLFRLPLYNKPRYQHNNTFRSPVKYFNTMSGQQHFSNADTGSKTADPYTKENADNSSSLEEKVVALSGFMNTSKFGMMTTRDSKSGHLISRCMAMAAQVRITIGLAVRELSR